MLISSVPNRVGKRSLGHKFYHNQRRWRCPYVLIFLTHDICGSMSDERQDIMGSLVCIASVFLDSKVDDTVGGPFPVIATINHVLTGQDIKDLFGRCQTADTGIRVVSTVFIRNID